MPPNQPPDDQPTASSNDPAASPANPDIVNQQQYLGSRPVVYEPAPLPGETGSPMAPSDAQIDEPRPVTNTDNRPGPPDQPPEQELEPDTTRPGSVPYSPAAGESAELAPAAPPTDANSDNVSFDEASAPPPKSKLKQALIIGGIALVVLVIGLSILTLTTKKKTSSNKNNPANGSNQGPSGGSTVPQGYKTIDRLCFSFALLDNNLNIDGGDACFLQASYGDGGHNTFNVYPETQKYTALADFTAAKKKAYNSSVASEEDIKIDGLDAHKVIENIGGPSNAQLARIYVLTPNKKYTYQSVPITGFEINASLLDDSSKEVLNQAISSWKWK